jgi:hypothetical protein
MTEQTKQPQPEINAEELAKLQAELKAKQAAVKAAEKLGLWERSTKSRNPAYVMGSVRKAVEKDSAILGHAHGMVCLIKCTECGKTRLINKQDAFQVKHCKDCRKTARQNAAKAKRESKKLADANPETIAAEIAKLQGQLDNLDKSAKPAKRTRRKAS